MRIYGFGAKLSAFMDEAEDDVLAYMSFSADHWPKIHSTNGLECLNGAVKRRSEVVGLFANEEAIVRLRRRHPVGATRRMGRPAGPLHDTGNHRRLVR